MCCWHRIVIVPTQAIDSTQYNSLCTHWSRSTFSNTNSAYSLTFLQAAEYRSLVGLDGAVGKVLSQLEDVCRHPYVAGCSVTIADVHLFAAIGWWASGFFSKAVTLESLLMNSPKLRATAQLVGAIPQVNKYYQLPKHSTPLHANYKTLSTAKL